MTAGCQCRLLRCRASVRGVSERAAGYVTELPYTPGYHPGLDPAFVVRRLGELGHPAPAIARACELGFGRGINLAIHAVAGRAHWWGNDLLPEHVAGVRALTRGLTDRLQITAASFAEWRACPDLPTFDFIGLHGVWSWVSADNRRQLVDFIDERLAPGGVVYVSYNVLAGWKGVLPLREFLWREAERPEHRGRPLAERIELALQAALRHVASDPPELADDRNFERHLRRLRHQRKAYLAHEYFNRDWAPMRFSEVAAALEARGLVYAGQVLGDEARPRDAAAEDERDRWLQRSFRRDLWLRPAPGGASKPFARDTAVGVERARIAATAVLNDRLLQLARREPQLSVVASPLSGGGVDLGWRGLLALAAWRAGAREPAVIAARVAAWMAALEHPLVHADTVIRDAQEARQMLRREAQEFCTATLPRLRDALIEPP